MLFTKTQKLQSKLEENLFRNQQVGLVPTMGALHSGHLSLIGRAEEKCDVVVVSIFVNPTQFNSSKDLEKYPRNLENDLEMVQKTFPNTLVFAPSVEEIYGEELKTEKFDFGRITIYMEGQFRTGHFNGVGTVVKRLLQIVNPHFAFFGEKDFQQLRVIERMVEITKLPVHIIGCKTERESNGLAKSSRNELLSPVLKEKAGIIYRCLQMAKKEVYKSSIPEIKTKIKQDINALPKFELEYFEIADVQELIPTESIQPNMRYRAFIAVFVNQVRLIDNLALNY